MISSRHNAIRIKRGSPRCAILGQEKNPVLRIAEQRGSRREILKRSLQLQHLSAASKFGGGRSEGVNYEPFSVRGPFPSPLYLMLRSLGWEQRWFRPQSSTLRKADIAEKAVSYISEIRLRRLRGLARMTFGAALTKGDLVKVASQKKQELSALAD